VNPTGAGWYSFTMNWKAAQSSSQANNIFSNPLVIGGIATAVIAAVGAVVYFGVIAKGSSASASAGAKVTGATGSTAGSVTGNLGSLSVDDSDFLDSLYNANTATAAEGVTSQARGFGEGSGSSVDVSDGLQVDDSSFLDSLYNSSTPTSVDPSRVGSAGHEGGGSGPSSGRVDFRNDYFLNDLRDDRLPLEDSSPGEIIGTLLSSEEGFLCIPFLWAREDWLRVGSTDALHFWRQLFAHLGIWHGTGSKENHFLGYAFLRLK
jgi:hypothetical protein